jgi:hypothetical protein
MKLSDWAKKQGISYLTAYRWFKDGKLPVEAYQSESGTIIVKDDSDTSEQSMAGNNQSSDIMSIFLKKTVEFSKSNASVEDFAAYVLSNFSLKLNNSPESPRYSRNKPKPEDIQKHFQQFLKPKSEKPKPNMFVTEPETLDEIVAYDNAGELPTVTLNSTSIAGAAPGAPEIQSLIKDLTAAIAPTPFLGLAGSVTTYDSLGNADGRVSRNVDVTPQSINYTGSTHSTFSSLNSSPSFGDTVVMNSVAPQPASYLAASTPFQPTPKEVEQAHKALEKVANELHSSVVKARRGRKPSKKSGKK